MDCLFCQLKSNKDNIIYEDELLYVIVDRFPFSNRHLLIIPKEHFEVYHRCPEDIASALALRARALAIGLKMEKYNILQNSINGQLIKHCHVHLIEANDTGRLSLENNVALKLGDNEYRALVEEIKVLLSA